MEGGIAAVDFTVIWQFINIAIFILIAYGVYKFFTFIRDIGKKQDEIIRLLKERDK